MLNRILCAPMSFFDTTPKGRLINRFAADVNDVDILIPQACNGIFVLGLRMVGIIIVVCITNYAFVGVVLPILLAYWAIQRFYVTTGRQLRRILTIRRSPVFSHFSETLSGAATVRAYDLQESFRRDCRDKIDSVMAAFFCTTFSNRYSSLSFVKIFALHIWQVCPYL